MKSYSVQGHVCACPTYALILISTHNKNHVNSDPTIVEFLVMVMRARVVSPIFSLCHSALGGPGLNTPPPIQDPGWRPGYLC